MEMIHLQQLILTYFELMQFSSPASEIVASNLSGDEAVAKGSPDLQLAIGKYSGLIFSFD